MAIIQRILARIGSQVKDISQVPPQKHHIDKPVNESINKPVEQPFKEPVEELVEELVEEPMEESVEEPVEEPDEEPVDGSVDKPIDGSVNGPVRTQFTLEVTVIPVCENNDTPTSVISKGLVRWSRAMEAMNTLPAVKAVPGETVAMASIIINALNIMATVLEKERPERVYAYHVYATRTAIASFINLMNIVVKHLPQYVYGDPNPTAVLRDTFSAYIYFGIAVLTTPDPLSAHLAAAIGSEVKKTSGHTSALSLEQASMIAKTIMEQIPPPQRTDIRPLVSIFTSDQLAGLARRMAYYIDPHEPEEAVIRMTHHLMKLKVDVPAQFCPCKEESKNYPICLCGSEPYSQSEYDRKCSRKLLPGI